MSEQKNNIPTVKHGRGSNMQWVHFATSGSGTLKKLNGIIKESYLKIIQENIKESATMSGLR